MLYFTFAFLVLASILIGNDSKFGVETRYARMPDSNQSWLSDNAPNAMLYGVLVEGAVFMKMSPETIMMYEQKYQEALAMLKLLGEYKDVRDEARNDQIKIMPQGTTNV